MSKRVKYIFCRNEFMLAWLCLFLGLSVITGVSSCEKIRLPEGPSMTGQNIVLDKQNVELTLGDRTTITLSLENGNKFVKKFEFSSSNPDVAAVERMSGYSVQVLAKKVGTAVINFTSEDKEVELSCAVKVNEFPPDGITRILAIGNSFSEDALETFLYPISTAAGDSVVIANLYIGGASLEDHLNNATQNNKVYSYRKISKLGTKTTKDNVSIDEVLNDERWDFISFQQVSQLSGQYSTYQNTLPPLFNHVKSKVIYSRTKYVFHQTWAYAQNSTHEGFANYNNDQLTMYNAIMDAVQKAAALVPIDVVVPVGSAIQNGRTSFIGDNFCRDGYHLDLNVGRYLAACTWYEALFKKPVIGNTFNPNLFMLSSAEREMAQHAAHAAIAKPYQITDLVDYKTISFTDLTTPVFIDVAQQVDAFGWNGLKSPAANTTIPYLRNKNGELTRAALTITERFNNINSNGVLNTTTPFNMPNSVSQNSYFGNSKLAFNGALVVRSVIKFSGLDPAKKYNLCFFGSRGGTTEGRQTKYTSKGTNEATAYLMTGNNGSNIACTSDVFPDAQGNIFVTITAGESNDNASGFYYVNAIRISL